MRTIEVLMWKHMLVRKRKFFSTIVEFLLPLLFFILLFFMMADMVNPDITGDKQARIADVDTPTSGTVRLSVRGPIRDAVVLYYPDTTLTSALMNEVAEKLSLKLLDYFPVNKTLPFMNGYYPFTNKTQLSLFSKMMRPGDAVVIFHNLDGDSWPSTLDYTIRMTEDFHSTPFRFKDDTTRSHSDPGLQHLIFMRLQWAIDNTYISLRSGVQVNHAVSIQEFPYLRRAAIGKLTLFNAVASFFTRLSLIFTYVILVGRLVKERHSGVPELIKMEGVYTSTLALSHILNVMPIGVVYAICGCIVLKSNDTPLTKTNVSFLFVMLILYFMSIVAVAFACSYLVNTPQYSTIIACLTFFLFNWVTNIVTDLAMPDIVKLIAGLLPQVPVSWYYSELCLYEGNGTGVGFDNMTTAKDGVYHPPIFFCYVLFVAQIVLFFCLTWYFSLVTPGKYGQAVPWHLNMMTTETVTRTSESDQTTQRDERYFEELPAGLKVGIFVDNVTKKYPKHTALKNVTLKVFEGEITVLLGHNGAGKTVLMNVITGMTSPTSGKVLVYGIDSSDQRNQMRQRIGLCPQYNMFFPDLTLHEHIMFFALLKGGKLKDARESSRQMAAKMGLEPKLNDMWAWLSGGMQRRAQLACALIGDATVLILDEPTAGLDVETRRGLWDLLLSLRGARTVLLSTHYMEEADALGDRVAALSGGELRCFATNMFLKKAIGDGYRLTLTTLNQPKEQAITQKVQETVPDATVKGRTISSITYNLPANKSSSFPKLFSSLEDSKAELEIDSIGVGVSTLEEVFLKLCSNVNAIQGTDEKIEQGIKKRKSSNGTQYNLEKYYKDLEGKSHKKLIGPRLRGRQVLVLLKRQVKFILQQKWFFLILNIILPFIVILLITNSTNNRVPRTQTRSFPLDFDMYTDIPNKRILCNFQLSESTTSFLRTLDSKFPGIEFQATNDVSNTVLRIGKKSLKDYRKYLSGIEINDTDAKVLYTTTVPHIAPVTLNVMSNMLGMRYLNQSKYHIFTRNHPIRSSANRPKELYLAKVWAVLITLLFETTMTHCMNLPALEQATGARSIHIMSGCSIKLYWFTTFFFHMTLTLVFQIIPLMIAANIMELDSTIDQTDFLLVTMVILFIGAMALLAVMYWVVISTEDHSESTVNIMIFMLALFFPLIKAINDSLGGKGTIQNIHEVLHVIATPYTITMGMLNAVKIARDNAVAGATPKSYFSSDSDAPLFTIIILLVHAIFFMGLVIMIQRGMFNSCFDRLKNRKYKPSDIKETNPAVNKEQAYVAHEICKSPANIATDSILVHELHKNYVTCRRNTNAVRGVSLSIKKGECFGLLGVNGAGKTTIFKMLTVEECATRGKIYGNGYFLKGSTSTKYLQTLGYTPQHNGLDLFLTGKENLTLLLTLRGLEGATIKKEVKSWLKLTDLEQYADRRLEGYSGGCKRRLVAASSLCGGAAVTLLDEPSAGVDVAARRQLWTGLREGLRHQRSIIITSHSMDEMEALCDRIAILCAGRVRALGSPGELRAQHTAGHAVRFKIKHDRTQGNGNEVDDLNTKIRQTFDCELKDQHKTMLLYHINVTMHYSELFQALEGLKDQFSGLIEDYTVTETTLEEVFLALAEQYKVRDSTERV